MHVYGDTMILTARKNLIKNPINFYWNIYELSLINRGLMLKHKVANNLSSLGWDYIFSEYLLHC